MSYSDTSQATALLDPGFTVFSSATGARLDGAVVTLRDVSTDQPATVFSHDGSTSFPATVTSGEMATDGAGRVFDFAPGTFYFPVIPAGTYRIEVAPPVSYLFPSQVDDTVLAQLPAGPFVLTEGSRGLEFTVAAGSSAPNAFDVPVDPISAEVFVTKLSSKESAAVGDFTQRERPHTQAYLRDTETLLPFKVD